MQVRFKRGARAHARHQIRRHVRAVVDALEARFLLSATRTWTGAVDHDWNTPQNWNPEGVPTATDVSEITLTETGHVDINAGATVLGEVHLISGTINWGGGNIHNAELSLGPTTTMTITGAATREWIGGSVSNSGAIYWSGGAMIDTGSMLPAEPGLIFTNEAGGTFEMQGDSQFRKTLNNAPTFNNAGTFAKNAGTAVGGGAMKDFAAFNNSGAVTVGSGTLTFDNTPFNNSGTLHVLNAATATIAAGGTNAGSFSPDAGGTIQLSGGSFTLNPGTVFTGDGFYGVTGDVTIDGKIAGANFQFTNGSITGAVALDGTFNWTDGDILNTNVLVSETATFNILGTAERDWMGGKIDNSGVVVWAGGATINTGSVTGAQSGFAFNNKSGSLFEMQADGLFRHTQHSQPAFTNEGSFLKTGGTGSSAFDGFTSFTQSGGHATISTGTLSFTNTPFNNNGTIHVLSAGTVKMATGGSSTGSFSADADAEIEFIGGTFTVNGLFTGAGFYGVTDDVTINGKVTGANFQMSDGSIAGDFAIDGTMNWSGGNFASADMTVSAGSTLNIVGAATRDWIGGTTENLGTINWASGATINGGSATAGAPGLVIDNKGGGIFDAQADGLFTHTLHNAPTFNNTGMFIKSGGTAAAGTEFDGFAAFNNTGGSVTVQTGNLKFTDTPFNNGGALHVLAGTTAQLLSGGTSTGSFSADASGAIRFVNGAFAYNPGTAFTGDGFYGVTGDVTINGTIAGPNFQLTSGSLGGDVTLTGTINWAAGELRNADLTIGPTGTVNILGGAERNWFGGTVDNSGAIIWSAVAPINTGSTSALEAALVINNLSGGLFELQSDAIFRHSQHNPPTINNGATVIKTGGVGVIGSEISGFAAFNNLSGTGVVTVTTGSLLFDSPFNNQHTLHVVGNAAAHLLGGGTSAGNFSSDTNGSIDLIGGTFTFNPGNSFLGGGFYGVAGDVVINGTINGFNFQFTTGSIGGAPTLTGTMVWSDGDLLNANLTIAPTGVLDIINGGTRSWFGGTLSNSGVVNWIATDTILAGSASSGQAGLVIDNLAGGVFDAQADGLMSFPEHNAPTFNNAGTFQKSGGTGVSGTQLEGFAAFNNSGTVLVHTGTLHLDNTPFQQTAGSTTLNAKLLAANPTFSGGALVANVDQQGLALTLAGAASATFNATMHLSGLTITGATAVVSEGGNKVLVLDHLAITAGGKLDMKNNSMVRRYTGTSVIGTWDGSAYTGITGMVQTGSNGGAWDGSGIITSMSVVGDNTTRTLGINESAAVLGLSGSETTLWNGVTVDANCVIVKYTYLGDIDLNGEINGDDYFFLDSNVVNSGSVFGYGVGDVNLDGAINGDDYFWLDSQISGQGPPL